MPVVPVYIGFFRISYVYSISSTFHFIFGNEPSLCKQIYQEDNGDWKVTESSEFHKMKFQMIIKNIQADCKGWNKFELGDR